MKTKAKTKPGTKPSQPKAMCYTKPQKEAVWEVREEEPLYKTSKKSKGIWQLQEAKSMFCNVVKVAQKEPQIITVHGKETAVLISYEEYMKDKKPKMSAWEFMQKARLYGVELDIEPRRWEPDRDINL